MFIEAELEFRHYKPTKLEPGMLFINHINPGHPDKEHVQVWKITEDYFHNKISDEILIKENGFPVKPFIISDKIIITPDEIGTFIIINEYEDEEAYIEFGITEMNFILREFQGWCEVLIDEDSYFNKLAEPIYDENDKVIIKFIDEEEYIDDEEE
jgi:hypothetical protein